MSNNSLSHASEYYDPVKAHEYYMRTRELSGKQSTTGMSDTQKQALSYTKSQISGDKKKDLEDAKNTQKDRLETLRNNAEATRDRIKAKLESTLASLDAGRIKGLNKIPKNASPKMREFLEKQNANILKDNSEKAAAASKEVRAASREQLLKIGADLKTAVTDARNGYAAARDRIKASYESKSQNEYDHVRTQVQ